MSHSIPGKPVVDSNAMREVHNKVSLAWLSIYGLAERIRSQRGSELRFDLRDLIVTPIDTSLMVDKLAKAWGISAEQITNSDFSKLIAVILEKPMADFRLEPSVRNGKNGKIIRFTPKRS